MAVQVQLSDDKTVIFKVFLIIRPIRHIKQFNCLNFIYFFCLVYLNLTFSIQLQRYSLINWTLKDPHLCTFLLAYSRLFGLDSSTIRRLCKQYFGFIFHKKEFFFLQKFNEPRLQTIMLQEICLLLSSLFRKPNTLKAFS